jgi:hypothetical protein
MKAALSNGDKLSADGCDGDKQRVSSNLYSEAKAMGHAYC